MVVAARARVLPLAEFPLQAAKGPPHPAGEGEHPKEGQGHPQWQAGRTGLPRGGQTGSRVQGAHGEEHPSLMEKAVEELRVAQQTSEADLQVPG